MIFFNRYFDKSRLKALVLWSLNKSGEKTTIDLVEKLKDLGFHYATQAGLSLSIDDLKIPPNKPELILEAEIIVQSSQKEYEIGNLTKIERFQQMIDVWHRTSEVLKQNVVQHFRSTDVLNPVYMMAFSGARGNISQVRQLVGMRGLMADPQGQILDFPIRSNFREGLTLTEYVISCYGARKGLVDTALRTANSGYLTRRLVDVAQHIIVRQLDCGTDTGILVTDMKDGKKIILSLQKRLVGRVLAEKVEFIAYKNQDISPSLAAKLVKLKNQVLVRSPLTCDAKNSVCQLCYGWSLAHGNLVSLGEAVGVLAAQSIGEPGTQLTMRTFHTGGVFSGDVMQEIRSPINGVIKFSSPLQGNLIRTLHGKIAFLTKMEGEFSIVNSTDTYSTPISYQIPIASILFARHFEQVQERQLLAEFSSFVTINNQGIQAKFKLNSEKEGQIYFENVLLVVKGGKEGDIIKTALKFGSIWVLAGKLYESPIRSNLFTKPGDLIDMSSILNESILATPYSGFLELNKGSKQKEILFSNKIQFKNNVIKKIPTKNEIYFLNQLLNGNKLLSNSLKTYPLKKETKSTELNLKNPFINSFLKEVNYKKFGYFLSLTFFKNILIFYPNPLFDPSVNINTISLQIFDNQILKYRGLIFNNQTRIKYQKGQYFLIPQDFYQMCDKYVYNVQKADTKKFNKVQYIGRDKNLFYIQNFQGNLKKFASKKRPILNINGSFFQKNNNDSFGIRDSSESLEKEKFNYRFISKKIFVYKENPCRIIDSPLKSYSSEEKQFCYKNTKKNYYKKCYIPYSITKKRFSKYIKLKTSSNEINSFTKERSIFDLKLKLESGWISLAKKCPKYFFFQTYFNKPGNYTTHYQWDQTFSFSQKIELKENICFLTNSPYLQKTRYIKNKLFRIDKYNERTIFSKKSRNKKSLLCIRVADRKEQEIYFFNKNFETLKRISRNNLYYKNFYIQNKFLLISRKAKELNYQNRIKKTSLLQKLSNNLYSLYFYKNNSFVFNKQKITRLKSPLQNTDIQLISNWNKKQFNFNTPLISISLKLLKNKQLNKAKLEILFPLNLQFSIIRTINTCNFLLSTNLSKEKLIVTKQKKVFEQTTLSFTSFSSPYSGEITSTKIDIVGKQKSLLLTNKNQISFFNDEKNSFIKIGQLLRYGDQLISKIAVQESGQIIQIEKNKITLRKAQPILFSSQGVFHVDNGDLVEKNTPLITLFYQKLKTEDIVQGIPKIEELFEARQTKEGETLQENLHTKLYSFFNYYKQQFTSQEAAKKSIEKIQQILVNNVQKVYQSQGVTIADKHIEIIVRQMTTKVKITESGRTGLLRGELIDLEWVDVINLGIAAQNEMVQQSVEIEKAEYEPIILGITKAALETESFISASSFQETTRILSRAAIERKTDFLRGLKENVILGHLIPAGTGFTLSFDPQLKVSNKQKKLSWLNYKEIIKMVSK